MAGRTSKLRFGSWILAVAQTFWATQWCMFLAVQDIMYFVPQFGGHEGHSLIALLRSSLAATHSSRTEGSNLVFMRMMT